MQAFVVAVLVAGCFVYALWTLGPKAPRQRLALALLKWPLPALLQKPLSAAARMQGGCGCDGCDQPSALKPAAGKGAVTGAGTAEAQYKPVTFVRKP
ncbi:hypothetical protein DIC66_03170 [Rhodoferax lacus]|uniref:Uncharacterized protein n=1 Tax=Rhodoferax lacus TaxID=2184758 RepID=A0A3E1RHL5_9BURK|nr:hypothetical protein [Rhodoferax lacus]RFO98886.1 hypothetical protein DIC66_03170 [Rhodoferax lacus]